MKHEKFGDRMKELERRLLPRAIAPKSSPIKTKVVPLLARSIEWDGNGRRIEPFIGSAVVALNVAPVRAVLADTNEHMIDLYKGIQDGSIRSSGRGRRWTARIGTLSHRIGA